AAAVFLGVSVTGSLLPSALLEAAIAHGVERRSGGPVLLTPRLRPARFRGGAARGISPRTNRRPVWVWVSAILAGPRCVGCTKAKCMGSPLVPLTAIQASKLKCIFSLARRRHGIRSAVTPRSIPTFLPDR